MLTDKVATPDDPFLYNATPQQLENQILFSAFVAGKTARIQQKKLEQFWSIVYSNSTQKLKQNWRELGPSGILTEFTAEQIDGFLRGCRSGQYTRLVNFITKVFPDIRSCKLDLRKCSRDRLCEYPGFNMKSASFFLLFTRPEMEDKIACLDTHILAYLRDELGVAKVPKSTPARKRYLVLEQTWLRHKRRLKRNGAELDFEIWKRRSRGGSELVAS
jgi:thermostable 8-oxoguanine DNA glycosylase